MKIYTFYSKSHEIIYHNYFLESLKKYGPELELVTKVVDQKTMSGSFDEVGFNSTMKDKIALLLDAINENWGSWFIFSDCDIQFLDYFYEDLISYINNDKDIIAQSDLGTMCAGFFIGKADTNLKKIMEKIYNNIENFHNDQIALNYYNNMISWGLMDSNNYYTIANSNGGRVWNGDYNLKIPTDIIVHHANFTIGVENKIKLLEYIKENVKK